MVRDMGVRGGMGMESSMGIESTMGMEPTIGMALWRSSFSLLLLVHTTLGLHLLAILAAFCIDAVRGK